MRFIAYPNTSNFVKNTPLRVVFAILSPVFDILHTGQAADVSLTWLSVVRGKFRFLAKRTEYTRGN